MYMGTFPPGATAPRRVMPCRCAPKALGDLGGGILSKLVKISTPGPNATKLASTPKEIKQVIAIAGPALSAIPGWGTLAAAGAAVITGADQRDKAKRLQAAATQTNDATSILKAYQDVAGLVPGRLIGVDTLIQVAQAAGRAGLWPNVKGWKDAVVPEVVSTGCKGCTPPTLQAWVSGNANGNPVALVDAWGALVNSTWGSKWFVPAGPIQRQILIDLIDALIVQVNPNAPLYYGQAGVDTPAGPITTSPANPPPSVIMPVPPPTVAPPTGGAPSILPVPVSPSSAAGSATASSAPSLISVRPSVGVNIPLPAGVSIVAQIGYAPNGAPLFAGNDGYMYVGQSNGYFGYAGPVLTSAPAGANAPLLSTVAAGAATQATQASIDQIAPLVSQLLAQGASQSQAYTSALDRLTAQGVQVTPQVQQAVAGTVQNASGEKPWYQSPLAIGALAAAALFASGVI